ncbi:MAG: tetratricopeptide repeat protein [Bryobacteraceae bacterium]
MRSATVLFCGLLAVPIASSSAPPRNAAPGVKYVGSKVCAGCHTQIYAQYRQTAMGRSVTLTSVSLLSEPVSVHSDALNRDFRVYREGGDLYQSESESSGGRLVFESKHKIEYVIGSGENGMSFAVQRGDHLFQAPLSFYARMGKWDLSPGFEHTDLGFNRPLYDACITCHAGRPQAVPDRDGLYKNPAFQELAVGCENCHGPGELHVAERAKGGKRVPDDSIVNPARLPARLAEDICLKCHQGGDARALLPGKDYSNFRPGTPLLDTVAVVALPPSAANTDLLEHHVSMKLSACYRKSGGKLSCLTCHDPHQQPGPAAAPAYFRSRCFLCHTDQSCSLPLATRAKQGNKCAECHMPKRDVQQIAHSALTNHRIPRKRGAGPATLDLPEANVPDLPGLLLLDSNKNGALLPLVTRLSIYGELGERSPVLLARYLSLLEEAAKTAPNDPIVLAALGRRSLMENRPDALEFLTRAAAAADPTAPTLIDFSQALDGANRMEESAAILERAAALFPYSKEIRKRLILHYIQLKRYREARSAMTRYVHDFPEDDFMRGLLTRVSQGG